MTEQDELEIISDSMEPEELKYQIEQSARADHVTEVDLGLRRARTADRSIDSAVLVALISAGGSVLVALINILGPMFAKKGIIKIEMKDGTELEYPAGISSQKINEILEAHRKVGAKRIKIMKTRT